MSQFLLVEACHTVMKWLKGEKKKRKYEEDSLFSHVSKLCKLYLIPMDNFSAKKKPEIKCGGKEWP